MLIKMKMRSLISYGYFGVDVDGFLALAELEELENPPHVLLRGLEVRVDLDRLAVIALGLVVILAHLRQHTGKIEAFRRAIV